MSFEMFFIGRDLPVHRIGLGTGRLVGKGYWGPGGERADAVRLLRHAVMRGVDLIDTSGDYGPGLAEELIAEALRPYPVGLVIATKGGIVRTSATEWHLDGRPESLREMCEASLRRLGLETIDLYQLHRIDPQVPLAEQLGALTELRNEGKIRHIGLDSVSAEQLRAATELAEIASVQNRFHLLDREAASLLELCEERQVAFLPWAPLNDGALTASGQPVVDEIAAAHDATPAQVALSWLLHRSRVLLPAPGTTSAAHLDENLAAGDLELSPEELSRLQEIA
ncbi:aldo/keto reductase [Actinocorallia populi]|uniref:aldo/keto reductase n=1 Tax=Actinocorallia populi TaxID=2079200 RepID=UPI000D089156|nr:aldo/keto reductase [Actinocorallia populi]